MSYIKKRSPKEIVHPNNDERVLARWRGNYYVGDFIFEKGNYWFKNPDIFLKAYEDLDAWWNLEDLEK